MTAAPAPGATSAVLAAGGHICLVVRGEEYDDLAAGFLLDGRVGGEKPVLVAPRTSQLRRGLAPAAALVADPFEDLLGTGPPDPQALFAMFREQAGIAEREGFRRLRVAADMDWLLPALEGPAAVLELEVLLDRVVAELDATVVCAYRRTSFRDNLIQGVACVHPLVAGADEAPPFRLVAGEAGTWRLGGELDFACAPILEPALRATVSDPWVLDVAELSFVDVAALRVVAEVAEAAGVPLEVRHASPLLRRLWRMSGHGRPGSPVRFAG